MADLSKPTPASPGYSRWALAAISACFAVGSFFHGQYQHKQGVKEGVRRGACYWELMGSNADAYPREGYYSCRLQTADGLPVNVELTFDRPAEE